MATVEQTFTGYTGWERDLLERLDAAPLPYRGSPDYNHASAARMVAAIVRGEDMPAYEPADGWVTYLVCFKTADGAKGRVAHAGHYLGSTNNLKRRLSEHRKGRASRSKKHAPSRLTCAAVESGLCIVVTRTWPGREQETKLKYRGEKGGRSAQSRTGKRFGARNGLSSLCPDCRADKAERS